MRSTFKDIDSYIAAQPVEAQALLKQLRELIRGLVPEAEETISYGMPTYKLNGNLLHFAACKNHIGFYPAPSGISQFSKELMPYHSAKGSVQFPLSSPLPLDLIGKIVKFRVQEQGRLLKKRQAG